ncbi:zinc finger protein 182-like [Trichogramma pretiosum]|uniref:zinc finger protein 182-like n=1 Tax=Trichogramma pretiosum TaxID=7493 RepID=UPI0006C9A52D|nr:zinc finger protein 182-like [Trichogramma pretiosum]
MESSNLISYSVRVKKEPSDVTPSKNIYKMIDEKPDLQNLPFPPKNSQTHTLKKCDKSRESELDDELEIVVECEDVKPCIDLLRVKKIDDDFPNHMKNTKDINDKTLNLIKMESREVKQEFVGDITEELNLNVDCEHVEQNNKRRITKNLVNQHNRKCKKDFSTKDTLTRKPKSLLHCIAHSCDKCAKTFKHRGSLKTHIDEVHKNIRYACDICGKSFTKKSNLQDHIVAVHNGVKHTCDTCGKKFTSKNYLKIHIDMVHKGMTPHVCDLYEKSFTKKFNLQVHIFAIHKGVKNTCEICGKSFTKKSNLQVHIVAMHKGIKNTCDICGKSFTRKFNLKVHINSVHYQLIST